MEQILKESLIKFKIFGKAVCCKVNIDKYNEDDLLNGIARIISNTESVLVLYCKKLSDSMYLSITEKIKLLCAEFDAALLIYKRADIAFLSGVDGVFLDNTCLTPHQAEHIIGHDKLICYEYSENETDEISSDFLSDGEFLIVNEKKILITEL